MVTFAQFVEELSKDEIMISLAEVRGKSAVPCRSRLNQMPQGVALRREAELRGRAKPFRTKGRRSRTDLPTLQITYAI